MKRQRKSDAAAAVDAISNLPNAILSSILSLLPTKEAVATSVLSKRWIHVCHSIDRIDFPDLITLDSIESITTFNKFMDSVLVSRDDAGPHFINTFRLKIQYDDCDLASDLGFPNVTKWVDLVVQSRQLKYLRLHLYVDDDDDDSDDDSDDHHGDDVIGEKPILPISIFSCKTLVNLDLARFRVKGFKFSSIGFGFPSLKVLHLDHIVFQTVRDFMLLLTGCPTLEDLQATNIYFYYGNSLTSQEFERLSLPKLISAIVTQCWCLCFPMKALSNAEYLCIETSMLCAKDHEMEEMQCPCHDIPIFDNLTQLELHDKLELVLQKLQHFPKLQNLELYQASFETPEDEDDLQNWVEPEVIPQCLSSCIRTCTIYNFLGIQSELMLIKYILKNARNLEFMRIENMWDHPEIETELSACPKASATCELLFY